LALDRAGLAPPKTLDVEVTGKPYDRVLSNLAASRIARLWTARAVAHRSGWCSACGDAYCTGVDVGDVGIVVEDRVVGCVVVRRH